MMSGRTSVTSDGWPVRGALGADRFGPGDACIRPQDWAFIGINSERMSRAAQEDEQSDRLASVADEVRGKSVTLFLHKPLWLLGGSRRP